MDPFCQSLSSITASAPVGQIRFCEGDREQSRCALLYGTDTVLRLYIPRALGAVNVSLGFTEETPAVGLSSTHAAWCGLCAGMDVYELPLSGMAVGLYFFFVCVQTSGGEIFGHRHGSSILWATERQGNAFQVSVSRFAYPQPKEKLGGVIYHVFVDRFAKGGEVPLREGAVMMEDWDNGIPEYPPYPGAFLRNNTFFGGTLWGICEKLDALAALGVNTLYLSPIFSSPSNHKYDTADYREVDPMFGGEEALVHLIRCAKEKGMGIILDGVFNHTGADSRYFNRYGTYPQLGAYQSAESPYYTWYEFQKHPEEYTCWWGIEIMPRIHPDRPGCGDYIAGEGGVIEHYAALGIDGFRLDVADELSDAFLARIKAALHRKNPHSILYGEVWEDASNKIAYSTRKTYYLGRELDGVMNYPLRRGILDYFIHRNIGALSYVLGEVYDNTPKRILDVQMNLLGTHDTERVLTMLASVEAPPVTNDQKAGFRLSEAEYARGRARLMMAYTALATLPGIPAIYYGDEAGMQGYADPFNRYPYPWGREDPVLLSHYRAVGRLRRAHSVYRQGEFRLLHLSADQWIFARLGQGRDYITVVNPSERDLVICSDGVAEALLSGTRGRTHTVKAQSAEVLCTKAGTILEIL